MRYVKNIIFYRFLGRNGFLFIVHFELFVASSAHSGMDWTDFCNAGAFRKQCHLFSVLHEYARVCNFIDSINFNEGSTNAAQTHTHTRRIQSHKSEDAVDIR